MHLETEPKEPAKILLDVDKIGFHALLFPFPILCLCSIARGGRTVNCDLWEVVPLRREPQCEPSHQDDAALLKRTDTPSAALSGKSSSFLRDHLIGAVNEDADKAELTSLPSETRSCGRPSLVLLSNDTSQRSH